MRFFRSSNAKEDPTFVPYRKLVEALLDGDERVGDVVEDSEGDAEEDDNESDDDGGDNKESKRATSSADELDLVVDSLFGVSGDTMAKARTSLAAFCHLLSVWGHASSRFFEQQDTKSQQAFSEILVAGIDAATQLVNHGCLDGVEICNLASANEYNQAINILSESILVADVTLGHVDDETLCFLVSHR